MCFEVTALRDSYFEENQTFTYVLSLLPEQQLVVISPNVTQVTILDSTSKRDPMVWWGYRREGFQRWRIRIGEGLQMWGDPYVTTTTSFTQGNNKVVFYKSNVIMAAKVGLEQKCGVLIIYSYEDVRYFQSCVLVWEVSAINIKFQVTIVVHIHQASKNDMVF